MRNAERLVVVRVLSALEGPLGTEIWQNDCGGHNVIILASGVISLYMSCPFVAAVCVDRAR